MVEWIKADLSYMQHLGHIQKELQSVIERYENAHPTHKVEGSYHITGWTQRDRYALSNIRVGTIALPCQQDIPPSDLAGALEDICNKSTDTIHLLEKIDTQLEGYALVQEDTHALHLTKRGSRHESLQSRVLQNNVKVTQAKECFEDCYQGVDYRGFSLQLSGAYATAHLNIALHIEDPAKVDFEQLNYVLGEIERFDYHLTPDDFTTN